MYVVLLSVKEFGIGSLATRVGDHHATTHANTHFAASSNTGDAEKVGEKVSWFESDCCRVLRVVSINQCTKCVRYYWWC